MGDAKAAFASLATLDWSDVPQDQESLSTFLKNSFVQAELLANSVPLPPASSDSPKQTLPSKTATSAPETFVNPRPTALDARYTDLQKLWGKPIKISAKDNPLNVSVYKAAGHDRKGAWFARRSVHSGLDYEKWKKAMSEEFLTSLKVKKGPGSGAIRGIAGDERIDRAQVEGLGAVDAWRLSAAFPGPVSPREFVELLFTSDNALTEASAPAESPDERPRHYIIISRPLMHIDADDTPGLVRGNYESVELIREIPNEGQETSAKLIEWIMITRSDPGGGIPRFMVDRGTPGSIVADVPKFIDWAITRGDSEDAGNDGDDTDVEPVNEQQPDELSSRADTRQLDEQHAAQPADQSVTKHHQHHTFSSEQNEQGNSSLLGSLTTAVGSTVGGYLPPYLNPTYYHYDPQLAGASRNSAENHSISSASSDVTFASAENGQDSSDSDAQDNGVGSTPDGVATPQSSELQLVDDEQKPRNSHEKELLKLRQKRISLEQKMAKAREMDEQRARELGEKEDGERSKLVEKAEKERKRAEEKHAKEMRQLEERRIKEEKRAEEARLKEEKRTEERLKKAREKDVVLRTTLERDDARERLKVAEKERDILQKQVEELQKENTMLAQKLGSGDSSLKAMLDHVKHGSPNRSRASSAVSARSGRSGKSLAVSAPSAEKSTEKLVGDVA